MLSFFATCPKGLELLLVDELKNLGAHEAKEKLAGVTFSGDLLTAYRACLWSRLANRILLPLGHFPAASPEELYAGIQTITWDQHILPSGTLNVNFVCSQSNMTHSLYGAQKVKDAIVDQLRDQYGVRPNVASACADVNIHVLLRKDIAYVSIDLSGESLHKRGYRLAQGTAPLKENLAAAILIRAGWNDIARKEGSLLDPMCGSGTLLIEAALMAGDIAPGLYRNYFGFLGWKQHHEEGWKELWDEAIARREQGLTQIPRIIGYDSDGNVIKIAHENIQRAGLEEKIHAEKKELNECKLLARMKAGLVVMNPPYGERLGEEQDLAILYKELGDKLKHEFTGWQAAIFTGNPSLGKKMGLRSYHRYKLFNATIPCELLLFQIQPEWFVDSSVGAENERRIRQAQKALKVSGTHSIEMFINRLRKNHKHLSRLAEKNKTPYYRLYDADIPEFGLSIDRSGDNILVQEYPPVKKANRKIAQERLMLILAVLPQILEVPAANIFLNDKSEFDKKITPNAVP